MKHRNFILVFFIIIIICVTLCYFAASRRERGVAEIYSNGQLIHEIDLGNVTSPYEIQIDNSTGHNTIYVEHDKISVSDASCPDKLCVRQGAIQNSSYPIVCLPNNLIIKIKGAASSDTPDVISR